MIRAVLNTEEGPLIVLGVVEENLRKLRDGQPLHLDLGELLVKRTIPGDLIPAPDDLMARPELEGRLRLAVLYGATHQAIVEEIAASAPHALPMGIYQAAAELDERLRAEGRL